MRTIILFVKAIIMVILIAFDGLVPYDETFHAIHWEFPEKFMKDVMEFRLGSL